MKYLAGLELGGTKLIAVLAKGHSIIRREVISTRTPAVTLGEARMHLRQWQDEFSVEAIGIASFGPIRIDRNAADYGHMLATPKPGWEGEDIAGSFAGLGLPLAIDTDVNGAALAERAMGAGQGCDTLVYLTIGTGIGGGVIVGGKPAHGMLHPELGHMLVRRGGDADFAGICPFHGDCIEGLISGPALHARLGADAAQVPASDPRWEPVAADLAQLLASLVLTLSPQRIIVGGGVGLGQQAMVRRASAMVPTILAGYLPELDAAAMKQLVVPPLLGDDAGPLGAILLAESALA